MPAADLVIGDFSKVNPSIIPLPCAPCVLHPNNVEGRTPVIGRFPLVMAVADYFFTILVQDVGNGGSR